MNIIGLPDRTFTFAVGIDADSASDLISWLITNRKAKELAIVLNTKGGCVRSALALRDMIENMERCGVEIHIVVIGKCFSAGIILLTAVERSRRHCGRNSRFLIHPIGHEMNDDRLAIDIDRPDPEVLREMERETGRPMTDLFDLKKQLLDLLIEGSELDPEEARALDNHESYFSATEAIKYGLIGQLLDESMPPQAEKRRWWQRR